MRYVGPVTAAAALLVVGVVLGGPGRHAVSATERSVSARPVAIGESARPQVPGDSVSSDAKSFAQGALNAWDSSAAASGSGTLATGACATSSSGWTPGGRYPLTALDFSR